MPASGRRPAASLHSLRANELLRTQWAPSKLLAAEEILLAQCRHWMNQYKYYNMFNVDEVIG